MKIPPSFWQGIKAGTAAALVLCLVPACKQKVQPSGPPKLPAPGKTNMVAAPTNQPSTAYLSVFVELLPPKGLDPFYPNSTRRNPAAPPHPVPDKPPALADPVLKGVIGSPAHRLAIFDGAILEVGESGSVKVPNGKVRLKCIEIGEDYAIIQVEGEVEQKRLPLNKKGH